MDKNNLIAYLPFDASPTEDLCGNSWEAIGTPTIADAALQLDGSSYLQMAEQFEFTGQPFTVICKFSGTSNTTGGAVCPWQMYISHPNRIQLEIDTSGKLALWKDSDSTVFIQTAASVLDGQIHHVECDFDGATWYLFLGGVLIGTVEHISKSHDYSLYIGTNYQSGRKFTGTIDEFMIFDGVALHTEDFTPPTDDELFDLKMQFGHVHQSFAIAVETELHNLPKGWRYHNAGDADLLEVDGTTLRGDYSKSVTGVCFRGGSTSQDCFNTPAGLKEIWIRFDLWAANSPSGGGAASYRIGVYNTSTGGIIGISRWTNATDWDAHKITGTAGTIYGTPDGISRCLLHIKSHATNGLCELNVNGSTVSTSGNINGGRDLDTLIIYCSDSGYNYFSNIIVSETPLMLDSGWHRDVIPAEAQITAPKLNVRLKGADVPIPLRTKRGSGSVTVRVGNANFYCPATAVASLQAAVTFRLDDANHRLINSFG